MQRLQLQQPYTPTVNVNFKIGCVYCTYLAGGLQSSSVAYPQVQQSPHHLFRQWSGDVVESGDLYRITSLMTADSMTCLVSNIEMNIHSFIALLIRGSASSQINVWSFKNHGFTTTLSPCTPGCVEYLTIISRVHRVPATNSYRSGEPVKMKLWLQISGKLGHRCTVYPPKWSKSRLKCWTDIVPGC